MRVDVPHDRGRTAWWASGAALALAVSYVLYSFAGTVGGGLFLYYAARPLYRWLRPRVRRPNVAAGGALALLELPLLIVLVAAFSVGVRELQALVGRVNGGGLDGSLQPYLTLSGAVRNAEVALEAADPEAVRRLLQTGLDSLGFVGIGLVHLFAMYVIGFYLLRDDARLATWVRRSFADSEGVVETFLQAVDDDLHHVFFGTILNALLTAVVAVAVYSLFVAAHPSGDAVPYPVLIGLVAGAASLVPVVGNKLVYGPVTVYLVAVAVVDPAVTLGLPAEFLVVSYLVVDAVPDVLLQPYVSGRNLHRGLMMLAYILGTLAFGWYGVFVGPILLVVSVHFSRLVMPELLAGVPIRPYAVDPTHLTEWTTTETEYQPLAGDE